MACLMPPQARETPLWTHGLKGASRWWLLLTVSMGSSSTSCFLLFLLLLAALCVGDSWVAPLGALRLGRVGNNRGTRSGVGGRQTSCRETWRGRGLCGGFWWASGGARNSRAGQRNPGLSPRQTFPTSQALLPAASGVACPQNTPRSCWQPGSWGSKSVVVFQLWRVSWFELVWPLNQDRGEHRDKLQILVSLEIWQVPGHGSPRPLHTWQNLDFPYEQHGSMIPYQSLQFHLQRSISQHNGKISHVYFLRAVHASRPLFSWALSLSWG